MKWTIRGLSIAIIVVCAVWGFYLVGMYQGVSDDSGVAMLRLLYEYDNIQDIYDRSDEIRARCSEDVWSTLSPDNEAHWKGTWERTKNAPTKVRVVMERPGLIIYALDNEFVYPSYLWCFEYTIERGVFTDVREYKLVGSRSSNWLLYPSPRPRDAHESRMPSSA